MDRRRRTREARERALELARRTRVETARAPRHDAPSTKREAARLSTVSIDAIAAGGDGVGRVDGMAVFVPRTAPGDVVRASVTTHGRFARGRITELLSSSPFRVTPACRHYVADSCGGCQLQHLTMPAQRDAKARIVRDTLARIGRRQVEIPQLEASPLSWEYRRKLTLTLLRADESQAWAGGLHPLGQSDAIFPLEECRISALPLIAAWHDVQKAASYLPDGTELRITFRLVGENNRVAVTVRGGGEWTNWAQFAAEVETLAALWWVPSNAPRVTLVAPEPAIEEAIADFVQVNVALAARLESYVLQEVQRFAPARVIDAYAGTGGVALALTKAGVVVTAIEWDVGAATLMQRRLPASSVVLAAAVEDVIERALAQSAPADVVVLNPPRIGADERVTRVLNSQTTRGLRGLVYVSCDPATLARDLNRLSSWRIHSLHCFDMFPQTAHVETVCVLVPEAV